MNSTSTNGSELNSETENNISLVVTSDEDIHDDPSVNVNKESMPSQKKISLISKKDPDSDIDDDNKENFGKKISNPVRKIWNRLTLNKSQVHAVKIPKQESLSPALLGSPKSKSSMYDKEKPSTSKRIYSKLIKNAERSESEDDFLGFDNGNSVLTDRKINKVASVLESETPLKKVKYNDMDKKITHKSEDVGADDQEVNLQIVESTDKENSTELNVLTALKSPPETISSEITSKMESPKKIPTSKVQSPKPESSKLQSHQVQPSKVLPPAVRAIKDNPIYNQSEAPAPTLTTTSTSSTKLKPCEDPIYKKPFDFGWKREFVLRALPNSRDKGNIYYITPNGKKLRTRNEIQSYLSPGLSFENFTFSKDSLNANPEHETVRMARPMRKHSTPRSKSLSKRSSKPQSASSPQKRWTSEKAAVGGYNLRPVRSKAAATFNTSEVGVALGSKSVPVIIPIKKKIDSSSLNAGSRKRSGIQSTNSRPQKVIKVDTFATNFVNVPLGYDVLILIFQYLNAQELLRAAGTCRLWYEVANRRLLWKTVRMENSQVKDWVKLAALLRRNETNHLDLRKMICPKYNSSIKQMWSNFTRRIKSVVTLKQIDVEFCPSNVVQNLFKSAPQLVILNARIIKCNCLNLDNIYKMQNLQELRLDICYGGNFASDLNGFEYLTQLRHLSLTHINDLGQKNYNVLGNLINLESLELGRCSDFTISFAVNVLVKLRNLKRLRLQKSTETQVTYKILQVVSKLPKLYQLELINFHIKDGFEEHIILCKNIKRLLLVPTYFSQSPRTNHIILSSMIKLANTLESFTWVVTLELLRETALYGDRLRIKYPIDQSIPVLKPVPGLQNKTKDLNQLNTHQIDILPLTKIQEILTEAMPNCKQNILKLQHRLTWRQRFV